MTTKPNAPNGSRAHFVFHGKNEAGEFVVQTRDIIQTVALAVVAPLPRQ
jgi:hypothetical protein